MKEAAGDRPFFYRELSPGLWFLLFAAEQAGELIHGVRRVATSGSSSEAIGEARGSTCATQLRLQQTGGGAANVGDKLGIRGSAMNLERHLDRTALAVRGAAPQYLSKCAPADRGSGRRNHGAAHGCDHVEVHIVLGIERAATHYCAEGGHDQIKVVSTQSRRSHVHVAGHLLDRQVLPSLDSRERGNPRHLLPEIKPRKRSIEQADVSVSDQLVRRPRQMQVCAERPLREFGALG